MTQEEDENEHSGEMQYPFLAHVLSKIQKNNSSSDSSQPTITVLPIMCGSLTTQDEIEYGKLLSPILHRPEVLTVISTDFCHWGRRFQYQPTSSGSSHNMQRMKIHEYIAHLDRQGMDLIASQQPGAFAEYLKTTRNTICGRHAVAVWLRAMEVTNTNDKADLNIRFVQYRQSSQVQSLQDSSVSYASAIVTSTGSSSVMINGVK
jgi:AmmeMemoRadiSam system protein B